MKKELNKVAKDINQFLNSYLKKQIKTNLIAPMRYGLFPGGKKIRSKLILDVGKIFKIKYQNLTRISAAVECIHAYSLIHDDLPCMDNDTLRRGKVSTHIKYTESTAVLAGNSLLIMAFEILSDKSLRVHEKIKIELIKRLSKCAGHTGIAGGQYLDLSFENKKITKKKIVEMQIKKTGRLFSFCCMVPVIIKKKNIKIVNNFNKIGSDIGLLFQIADDLIDFIGETQKVGKKTNKDQKRGKATLISLLGYKNTIKYVNQIKLNLFKKLKKYGLRSKNINETLDYVLYRSK